MEKKPAGALRIIVAILAFAIAYAVSYVFFHNLGASMHH